MTNVTKLVVRSTIHRINHIDASSMTTFLSNALLIIFIV